MAFGPAALIATQGLALLHLGENELALDALTRALSGELRDEVRAATLHNRGLVRQKLGDRAGAITDFESALQLNPALEQARQALAAAQQEGL